MKEQHTVIINRDMQTSVSAGEMRAAVFRGPADISLETIPIPRILEGEILLRVHSCGICGTDLKKIELGLVPPPKIFGHEFAGTVVETGSGVTRFKVGDRVAAHHHIPCRKCFYCRKKLFSQCEFYRRTGTTAGFEPAGGGFAEYVRLMDWIVEEGTVAIPDDVSFEEASFLEPLNTCLGITYMNLNEHVKALPLFLKFPESRQSAQCASDCQRAMERSSKAEKSNP